MAGPTIPLEEYAERRQKAAALLAEAGYDDVLSIENEDIAQPAVEGVEEAAGFVLPMLAVWPPARPPTSR